MTGISDVEHISVSGRGMVGVEAPAEICDRELEGACIPENWRFSVLVPLYKGRGDVRDCVWHVEV